MKTVAPARTSLPRNISAFVIMAITESFVAILILALKDLAETVASALTSPVRTTNVPASMVSMETTARGMTLALYDPV